MKKATAGYWFQNKHSLNPDSWHPCVKFTRNESIIQSVSIQSASRYNTYQKSNGEEYIQNGIIHVKKGILNKKNVWDYQVASYNKKENIIFTKRFFTNMGELKLVEENNINFFKAYLLSLYKPSVFLTNIQVDNLNGDVSFIEYLNYLFKNNMLHPIYEESFKWVNSFIYKNGLNLNTEEKEHKIVLLNYIIENTTFYENKLIDTPNNIVESSKNIQKSIDFLNNI